MDQTGKTAIRIFLTLWMIYLIFLSPYPQSIATNLLDGAISLVDHRTFELRNYHELDTAIRDGRSYSGYPPGCAWLAAPVYLAAKPFIGHLIFNKKVIILHILCVALIAAPLSALTATLFYFCLRRLDLAERRRILLTFLFGLGTMCFSYACGYYKKPLATFFVFAAFYLLFREKQAGWPRNGPILLAGLSGGLAVLCDYPYAVIVALLGIYLLAGGGWRRALAFVAGGLPPAAALLFYHWRAFGAPLATSYQFRINPEGNVLGAPDPLNFLSIYFGWKDGYFIYTPVAWLALWGLAAAWRRRQLRAEAVLAVAIALTTGLLFSGWVPGDVEYSHPNDLSLPVRYLHVIGPFLMLFAAFALESAGRALTAALGGLSVFCAYLAAQAGFIPHGVWPFGYAGKVLLTSFGTGCLFSEFLPRVLRILTLHLYIARPNVRAADLLHEPARDWLAVLVLNQLLFFILFLVTLAAVALAVKALWRNSNSR